MSNSKDARAAAFRKRPSVQGPGNGGEKTFAEQKMTGLALLDRSGQELGPLRDEDAHAVARWLALEGDPGPLGSVKAPESLSVMP
ncbi:hypothetical protein DC522_28615 [Microvirga sp. KLBC 81]|nr:hypothetical protein DC522_28615 [Microvirga sp. KLBC 81]